jgi:Uma2 family endonuclease
MTVQSRAPAQPAALVTAEELWIIEPELRTVTVYRSLQKARILTANDTLSGEKVVPGFTCQVAELFVG